MDGSMTDINKEPQVTVLMSTYNGELFLREQLDSIIDQQSVNVKLKVRDDGSTDNTIDILLEYADKMDLTRGKNIGVGNSFMQLVYSAGFDSDYYAFSDQDDIWMSNKLAAAIDKLSGVKGPALYASNQLLVDAEGREMHIRYDGNPGSNWEQTIRSNYMCGCTMVWNKEFQRMVCEEKRRPSEKILRKRIHDVWFSAVADLAATLIYDNETFIKYRQHKNNVVGAGMATVASRMKMWAHKIKDPGLRNGRSELCRELCRRYADIIDSDALADLEVIGAYREKKYYKKKALHDRRIINKIKNPKESEAGYKLKVLFNVL